MADDIKEPDLTQPIKRLNYSTGQFLEKEDFLDEQQYHMAMRRRGNRVLYFGKGVLDESGFKINDLGNGKIEVTPGIAIDAEGREIVLVTKIEIDLTIRNLQPNSNYVVTVEYDKQARDEQSTNDNDRSDFTRVLEEPKINVQIPGPQSAGAIVIANLVTKADGTVEKIEDRGRERAKARFAGDLTIGQGGNGSLNTRHINGKEWRNDNPDDLFLNWGNARDVHIGGQTRSSLFVCGQMELKAPDSEIYSLKLSRTDEAGRQHQWALWHMNQQYRKNALEIWEYKSDSAGKVCDGNPADGAICTPRLVIAEGGNVGIGTSSPSARLEVLGVAVVSDGNSFAAKNNYMANGSLTIGSTTANFGGSNGWNSNTAALLFETLDNTEIAVHDSRERVASLMYYEGGNTNRITIGRNMGWGTINSVEINGTLKIKGNGGVLDIEGTDHAYIQWYPDGLAAGRKAWIGYGSASDNGLTIRNDIPGGPVHIYGDHVLYLLNKQGVIVGKHWGGNGNLAVDGDIAVGGKHALRGNDTWLRLNQDKAFTSGVHTPGLFYPGSLHVGGGVDPGTGNASVVGNISIGNSISYGGHLNKLDVAEGDSFARIRAHDLWFGHSSRHNGVEKLGRALVDESNTLTINYGSDWPYVKIEGKVSTPSSRQIKENIQALSSHVAKRIIATLEPVSFSYKSDSLKSQCLGFIAEDAPAEVASPDYDAIYINHIVAALTCVVKAQQNAIEQLQQKVILS